MDPTSVPASVEWSLFLLIFFILVLIGTLLKIPTWLEERRNKAAASSGVAMASDPPTLPYVIEPELPSLYEIEPDPPQIAPKYRQINGIEIKPWQETRRERMALREERAAQARAAQERSARIEAILRTAHLPEISYVELAQGSDRNILIVGPKGSGKTTLLNRLIALRAGYVEAFDPHNEPGKWPCPVVGGGERFEHILRHLTAVYALMRERYHQSNAGTRSQASYQQPEWAITLVGDEWGGIVAELPSKGKSQLGAGAIQAKLLARGRKVGIGLLVAAHDDTAAQVGLEGEMGLLGCYDFIIYLGSQATSNSSIPKDVREEARAMKRPALVLSTERQAWSRLSLDTVPSSLHQQITQSAAPSDYLAQLEVLQRPATPVSERDNPLSERDNPLSENDNQLQQLLSEFLPLECETGTPLSVPKTDVSSPEMTVSPAETVLITLELQRGKSVATIAKSLHGYSGRNYQTYRAKVERVKALYDQYTHEHSIEDPPPFEASEARSLD